MPCQLLLLAGIGSVPRLRFIGVLAYLFALLSLLVAVYIACDYKDIVFLVCLFYDFIIYDRGLCRQRSGYDNSYGCNA